MCVSVLVALTVAVFLTTLPVVRALPSSTISLIVAPFSEDNDKGCRGPTLQLTLVEVVLQFTGVWCRPVSC